MMFRDAMFSVAAALAVVASSTGANAESTWLQRWEQRHPWLHSSLNQKTRLPMTRNVSPCPGMKNYVISGGRCTDMGAIRLQ